MRTQYLAEPTAEDALMVMTGVDDPRVLRVYLSQAEKAVRAYTGRDNLRGLDHLVIELAAYRIDKRGADFQTAHSENGVSRTWGSDEGDAPSGFWRRVDEAAKQAADGGTGWVL